MLLAPPLSVPRSRFNPLPLYIGLFCLLWSFAFVAGKIGVTDCPPLILLAARFSLAGLLGLIVSANPVFTAALAALLLGEGMTRQKAAGLLLGVVGVIFIVWHRL